MTPQLELSSTDFARALAPLIAMLRSKRTPGQALVGYRDGTLRVELGGVVGKAPATGQWDGEARIAGAFLLHFAKLPASDERLTLVVEGDELRIRSLHRGWDVGCVWEASARPDVFASMNATLAERYQLALKYSDEELARMGVLDIVAEARVQVHQCVVRAANALKPLGLSENDVARMVIEQLSR